MKLWVALVVPLVLLNAVAADDTCPSPTTRKAISAGSTVCCNTLIKTVVETGMNTLNLFGGASQRPIQALGVIAQTLQGLVQKQFGTSFELIISPKDFQVNTHYNGTQMCKFESKNLIIVVYETPVKYDINSPREQFLKWFAVKDILKLPGFSSLANPENLETIKDQATSFFG